MIIWYALLVVWRAIVFFLLWAGVTFVAVGAYMGSWELGALAGLAVWAIAYRRHAYGRCVRCNGSGKFWNVTGAYWYDCPRCGGRGRAWRLGHPMN